MTKSPRDMQSEEVREQRNRAVRAEKKLERIAHLLLMSKQDTYRPRTADLPCGKGISVEQALERIVADRPVFVGLHDGPSPLRQ